MKTKVNIKVRGCPTCDRKKTLKVGKGTVSCHTCTGTGLVKQITTVAIEAYDPDWFRAKK